MAIIDNLTYIFIGLNNENYAMNEIGETRVYLSNEKSGFLSNGMNDCYENSGC